jgi:asparagine synthetase B (glutamine-hydrolysing)
MFLAHFDGIFAFAFYNSCSRALVLARNLACIKPLHIGRSTKGIIYSSHCDQIINPRYVWQNPVDEGGLGAYQPL